MSSQGSSIVLDWHCIHQVLISHDYLMPFLSGGGVGEATRLWPSHEGRAVVAVRQVPGPLLPADRGHTMGGGGSLLAEAAG